MSLRMINPPPQSPQDEGCNFFPGDIKGIYKKGDHINFGVGSLCC